MFASRIGNLYAGSGEGDYTDGFRHATQQAEMIAEESDSYIERLEYYIRKMAGDEVLQEIKEEAGV